MEIVLKGSTKPESYWLGLNVGLRANFMQGYLLQDALDAPPKHESHKTAIASTIHSPRISHVSASSASRCRRSQKAQAWPTRYTLPSLTTTQSSFPQLTSANKLPLQGASPRELLLEACRRNNTDLLNEVISSQPSKEKTADLLNDARDGVGNYCLHVAVSFGSCTY